MDLGRPYSLLDALPARGVPAMKGYVWKAGARNASGNGGCSFRAATSSSRVKSGHPSLLLFDPLQPKDEPAPEQPRPHLHGQVLPVVRIPDPYLAAIFHRTAGRLGCNPDRGKAPGRRLYRLARFHLGGDVHRLAAIVGGKHVRRIWPERLRRQVEDPANYVGHTTGDLVLRVLALPVLQVGFIEHAHAPRVIEIDQRLALVEALFSMLRDRLRAQAGTIERRLEAVVHRIEQRNDAA